MTDRSALPRYRSALRRSDTRRGLFRAVKPHRQMDSRSDFDGERAKFAVTGHRRSGRTRSGVSGGSCRPGCGPGRPGRRTRVHRSAAGRRRGPGRRRAASRTGRRSRLTSPTSRSPRPLRRSPPAHRGLQDPPGQCEDGIRVGLGRPGGVARRESVQGADAGHRGQRRAVCRTEAGTAPGSAGGTSGARMLPSRVVLAALAVPPTGTVVALLLNNGPRTAAAVRWSVHHRCSGEGGPAPPAAQLVRPTLVDDVLELAPVVADSTEKRGCPPYDPRLMVRLWTGSRS